jgi:competence protein ComEA
MVGMTRKALGVALALALGSVTAAPVDINTADAQSLTAGIKGVGTAKAQAIVDYREQHGRFQTVDELAQVRGIGPSTVERNRDNLSTGESSSR